MLKILLLFILITFKTILGVATTGTSGAGGTAMESKGITIAPPPMPQEILPPKPIIISPLLVKQHRNRKRVHIYRAGPSLPPLGFDQGRIYPAMDDFNGFPDYRQNRKLKNQRKMLQNLSQNARMFSNYQNKNKFANLSNFPNSNKNMNFQNNEKNRKLVQQIIMENTNNEDPEYTKKLSAAGGTSHWSLSPKFEREKDNEIAQEKSLMYSTSKERFKEIDEKIVELNDEIIEMKKEEKQGIGKLDADISDYRSLVEKAKGFGYKFI